MSKCQCVCVLHLCVLYVGVTDRKTLGRAAVQGSGWVRAGLWVGAWVRVRPLYNMK